MSRIYRTPPALVLVALALGACEDDERLGPPACPAELRDGSAADTWIRVEPGSFMMGTNEEFQEWYYVDDGVRAEVIPQMHATITRPYEAMATEVTNALWDEVMPVNPSPRPECRLCPVEGVGRADTLFFANALSQRDGLPVCYDLSGCTGEPGTRSARCPVDMTFDFDCEGYRLPTAGEFEYIARSGATTDHHCGALRTKTSDQCVWDYEWLGFNPRIQAIYPDPRTVESQPVRTLCPSPWGFYDVGGNVAEHVWDLRSTLLPEAWAETVVDPVRPVELGTRPSFQQAGDSYWGGALGLVAAGATAGFPGGSGEYLWPAGFRLVRTVPVDER